METWVRAGLNKGGPNDQLISWDPDTWSTVAELAFPSTAETLAFLIDASIPGDRDRLSISRQSVRDAGASLGPHAGVLAALVWGFGPTGYGASRTAKMLTSDGAAAASEHIWVTAREQGAQAGFSALWHNKRSCVRGLGTAFGTKVLYFAATAATPRPAPLVLDQFVYHGAQRLAQEGAIGDARRVPDPRRYLTSATYAKYCAWAEDQAPGAGDNVEYVLFQEGRR
jgi:hypothetical protein